MSSAILPFPLTIDRDAFGHYISGFTDGEGSFLLTFVKGGKNQKYLTPRSEFTICTRADDIAVLRLIRSFFGCGNLRWGGHDDPNSNAKPRVVYTANKNDDLCRTIIPHFKKYPLHAKKSRDFVIWESAVLLQASVVQRAQAQGRDGCFVKRWTDTERAEFAEFQRAIRDVRVYDAGDICPEELRPTRRPGRPPRGAPRKHPYPC